MQQVVAVDIGNSSIKLATAPQAAVVRIDATLKDNQRSQILSNATREFGGPCKWLVCSVNQDQAQSLEAWVVRNRPDDAFCLIAADDIELRSLVDDRSALGRDRLLAAWHASVLAGSNASAIVVDAGTAVTIDVVTANEGHMGGIIFPGSHTCLSAVSSHTDALPDLAQKPTPELSQNLRLGTSTEPAILLGVHQLQLFGMVAMVSSLKQQHPDAIVYCCGGALESVQHLLPDTWQYEPHFLIDAIFSLERSSK